MFHEAQQGKKSIVGLTEGMRIVTEITEIVYHSFIIMLSPADILAGLLVLFQGHFSTQTR